MGRETTVNYRSDVPAVRQSADWTCSACSLAWLNCSLFIDVATDEWSAVNYIGTPTHINSEWGLMDGSGSRLAECLTEQGAAAFTGWLDWYDAYQLASRMPLLIGGQAWYHWVGVRGVDGNDLAIANPAPGWMGVYDLLSQTNWNELGPFAVVAVPLSVQFPPLPNT
jgi:hypothetical protein